MMINFQSLLSRSLIKRISDELDLAGIKIDLNTFIGFLFFSTFFVIIIVGIIAEFVYNLHPVVSLLFGILASILYLGAIYTIIELQIDTRRSKMEEILPDFLQITAANIRSGMPIDRAMVYSARPEFAPLTQEVQEFNRRIASGESLQNSLIMLSNSFRSRQLKRTVNLMIEGITYGGGMVDLLERVAADIRQQQLLQKEIAGQLFMYSLFIVFASIFAAPLLFAVSVQMIKITTSIWSGISTQLSGGKIQMAGALSMFSPKAPSITSEDFRNFAIATMIGISIFAAFIVSSISSGVLSRGIRYVPIFIIVSLLIFYGAQSFLESMFGSFFGAAGGAGGVPSLPR
ncbi:MAG: type II secretion system F family protein [Candidatus Micrarchaeia archaeon]